MRLLLIAAVFWSTPALADCEDELRAELLALQALLSTTEAELAELQQAESDRLARIERAASQPAPPARPERVRPPSDAQDDATPSPSPPE